MDTADMLDFTHRKNYLRIWIVERNGDDFILEARVWVDHFAARAGCDVTRNDLQAWRTSLQGVYASLRGEAILSRPGVHVAISATEAGTSPSRGWLTATRGGATGSAPCSSSPCRHWTRPTSRPS